MAQKAEMDKESKTKRDGAKLSFQEKMALFAKENGEKNAPKNKAKISKAQREIDDPNAEGGEDQEIEQQ